MSPPGLVVVRPGFHTLVEDLGRIGYYRQGMTTGGPADLLSFLWANRLCGNRGNTTALEVIIGGLEVQATADTQVAVTGADIHLCINGRGRETWRSHNLRAGDRLQLGHARRGVRCYLAVRGGLGVKPMFASTATVVREQLGGLNGGPLQAGDILPITPCRGTPDFGAPPPVSSPLHSSAPLRAVPGWQARELPRTLKRDFFGRGFVLSGDCNRMGYRLTGEPLADCHLVPQTLLSEGLVPGAIQIPPQGLPIIMHVDHQTIGGYPKIATLAAVDLWRLAQLPAHSPVAFAPITAAAAAALLRAALREFERTSAIALG